MAKYGEYKEYLRIFGFDALYYIIIVIAFISKFSKAVSDSCLQISGNGESVSERLPRGTEEREGGVRPNSSLERYLQQTKS
jgi:hypothetical protein